MNTEASIVPTKPLASFQVQVFDTKPETPGDDDFRITIPEVHPEGPVILVHRYEKGAVIPVRHEGLSYFLIQSLTRQGVVFKVMQELHVRVKQVPAEEGDNG